MTKKVAVGMTGTHGSTFGGNPLAMKIGNAVLDKIKKKFLKKFKISQIIFKRTEANKNEGPEIIKEIRGFGLLIALNYIKIKQSL